MIDETHVGEEICAFARALVGKIARRVTVHRPETGSFFGPLRAQKWACLVTGQGKGIRPA